MVPNTAQIEYLHSWQTILVHTFEESLISKKMIENDSIVFKKTARLRFLYLTYL